MSERPSQLPVPGQIIAGRYRIESFLAQGGYGAVYVAEQLATEATVALKVLSPNVLASEDAVERFELEARVAGRVRSDFIVRILDAGVDEPTHVPFLVMELLEGESLHDHVKRVGPLGAADVVTFMMQVAQGLDKAHGYVTKQGKAAPIVHRDLKPENLFLTVREDGLKVVKILDFGIAKVLSEDVAMSRGLKGTPLYMAHEQLHGEALSPKTDIWAFGLITFFLLTGRPYWLSASAEQASLATVIAEVLTSSIAPASDRARKMGVEPAWTAAFDEWFTRCVNRDSQARFASAGDAASALAAALLGQGWSATLPPGLFPPESTNGPVSDGLQLARSESVSAAVVSTARLTRPTVVPRSLVAGGALLVAAAFAYAILHREPTSAPKAPVASADAHVGPEAVNALPSARSPDPVPPPHSAAAPPAPSSSAVIETDGRPSQKGKNRPGAPHAKASEGTAQPGSAPAIPSPGNSSERIYNER